MKTAIITCHYNWFGWQRPRENLRRFLEATHGLPVYGVEVQLAGHPMQTTGRYGWRQIEASENQVMMQKERLLNLAAKQVPSEYKALIWIDADVLFESETWYADTARALDLYPVVQPFTTCRWLGREGETQLQLGGIASQPDKLHRARAHPGFAMAARRTLWRHGGLYDSMIVGNGDVGFAAAVLPETGCAHVQMSEEMRMHYEAWRTPVRRWLKGRPMHAVPGTVSHLWHGDMRDRRYTTRNDMLLQLIPQKHLTVAENGLMSWTAAAPFGLRYAVRAHFANRNEDGQTT